MLPLLPALILLALQGHGALPRDARAIDPFLNLRDAVSAVQHARSDQGSAVREAERNLAQLIAVCLVSHQLPEVQQPAQADSDERSAPSPAAQASEGYGYCRRTRDGPGSR